jgi:RimJ/RimL family protein N-acetyltransferase
VFELQPTLVGSLITLRPLREEDFPDLFAVSSDPLIWEQHPDWDRYKEDVFREFFRVAMASGGALVAIDNVDGRMIGSSRYFGYDPRHSEIEIGWTFLARAYWGGIYNGEMKQLMLSHAFRFVNRVVFLIGETNIRSQRAVEKIGGVRTGTRPTEAGMDRVVYQLTSEKFRNRSSAFHATRVERTGDFPVPLPPEKALRLFSPEGERSWVVGWDPEYLHPNHASTAQGSVFRTAHGGEETLWMILAYDPSRGEAEYMRVSPGSRMGTVRVKCRGEGEGRTRVIVTYALTGLSLAGNAVLTDLTPEKYTLMLSGWRDRIAEFLERRSSGSGPPLD